MPHSRLPDVAQLRAAVAVAAEGSVTRAGDRIGLTQPAVSRLIASLEQELGFALFHRTKRRLLLSEEGRTFLRYAEASLGSLGKLSELGCELKQGRSDFLRVGAVSALAYGLAPQIVAQLVTEQPGLSIDVEELDRAEQIEGILSHHLDVGLVALPFGSPGLRVDVIAEGDAVCLLPADHPLVARDYVDPAALRGERFVRLRDPRMLQQMTEDVFNAAGITRPVAVTVDSTPLMVAFVAGGLGLAITHSMAAVTLPAGIVARPFRPILRFGYAALTREVPAPTPVVDRFICIAASTGSEAVRRLAGC